LHRVAGRFIIDAPTTPVVGGAWKPRDGNGGLAPACIDRARSRPDTCAFSTSRKGGRSALKSKYDVATGDLSEIYRRLSPWLHRRIAARTLRFADVDDLVQESFIRLGRYEVKDRAEHPRALLLRIASNLAIDASRRSKARGGDRHVTTDAIADLPGEEVDPGFTLDLKRTIMDLPPRLRDTFLLARFTPMTNDEIAAHQGISTKTVEWRISRAVAICLARLGT
jgi:RNA polymerase sigma factor (sigma-70 family)